MDLERLRIPGKARFSLRSPAFQAGEAIPVEYTGEGDDISPPLDLANLPEGTESIAIIMEDPDAPDGVFTHWTAWNIPASGRRIDAGADIASMGGREGRNDFGGVGYRGPLPPKGESHRYYILAFALHENLHLEPEVPRDRLEAAMEGRVLAVGETMGTYERSSGLG